MQKLAKNAFDLLAVKEYFSQQRVVTEDLQLAKAGHLPQEKLTVYLQLQMDSLGSIKSNNAKRVYHLTDNNLQTCRQNIKAQLFNSNADTCIARMRPLPIATITGRCQGDRRL